MNAGTDVYRAFDGGDVVVDVYGPVARVEVWARRWPGGLDELVRAHAPDLAHAVAFLRPAGGKTELRVLRGDPPAAHVVHEDGVRLLVRCADEDAAGAGVFVDHREGRAFVKANARGRAVLNLFAHAGAFGAAAVVGGAARVDHVDAAKKCAPWAALNLALNGEDPKKHRFLVDDALAVARKMARKGPAYGVVVCDPPTTALRPGGARFHVERDLEGLAADCLRALLPGGALVLSCNDRALSVDDVAAVARAAAAAAGRVLDDVSEVPLPPDVKTQSMRGVIARCRV